MVSQGRYGPGQPATSSPGCQGEQLVQGRAPATARWEGDKGPGERFLPSLSKGHQGAGPLLPLARGPLIENDAPISKGAARPAALCPGPGGTGSCCGLRGSLTPSRPGPAALRGRRCRLQPGLARRSRFPRALRASARREKTPRQGLNCTPCLQPRQFRGWGRIRTASLALLGGMCEMVTSTHWKISRLPSKSGGFPPAAPGEGALRGAAGSQPSPLCPQPLAARSGRVWGLIAPRLPNPRAFSRPRGGKARTPAPQARPSAAPGRAPSPLRRCSGAHPPGFIPFLAPLLHPAWMPGNASLFAAFYSDASLRVVSSLFIFFFLFFSFFARNTPIPKDRLGFC